MAATAKTAAPSTVEYVFSNGVTLTGTADQLLQYAKLIGEVVDPTRLGGSVPKGYYFSSSHGLIKISEMDTVHLVNALSKRTVDYFTNIRPKHKDFDLKAYLAEYLALTESPEIEEMYMELSRRKK
jgi:hypothetical protein